MQSREMAFARRMLESDKQAFLVKISRGKEFFKFLAQLGSIKMIQTFVSIVQPGLIAMMAIIIYELARLVHTLY